MFDQTMRTTSPDQTRSLEAASQKHVALPVRAIDWGGVVARLSSSGPYWHATHQITTRHDKDLFPWED